jgi:hypothetical protein
VAIGVKAIQQRFDGESEQDTLGMFLKVLAKRPLREHK